MVIEQVETDGSILIGLFLDGLLHVVRDRPETLGSWQPIQKRFEVERTLTLIVYRALGSLLEVLAWLRRSH